MTPRIGNVEAHTFLSVVSKLLSALGHTEDMVRRPLEIQLDLEDARMENIHLKGRIRDLEQKAADDLINARAEIARLQTLSQSQGVELERLKALSESQAQALDLMESGRL